MAAVELADPFVYAFRHVQAVQFGLDAGHGLGPAQAVQHRVIHQVLAYSEVEVDRRRLKNDAHAG
jgi:hypothetical protein